MSVSVILKSASYAVASLNSLPFHFEIRKEVDVLHNGNGVVHLKRATGDLM